VIAYLDNIFIYSKTKKEQAKHIIKVLKALEKANIKINNKKSTFHVQRVNFLGYYFTTNGIEMDPVTEWALPELSSHWLADLPCLGMVNH
jgi:hypothetical protein